MIINNTIEKLINSIKQDSQFLKRDTAEIEKWCQLIVNANLPELPENYEYTYRMFVKKGEIVGEELISQRVYWEEPNTCWANDEIKPIMVLPAIPKSHFFR